MSASDEFHQDQPVLEGGVPLEEARAAVIALHGRGASAQGMLSLAEELEVPHLALLAPQAAHRSWYPASFMAPVDQNEPALGSALSVVADACDHVESVGLSRSQVVLLGFSQGACLATTFAVHHPTRYGGVVGLSGGLMGPEGASLAADGWLGGTPVVLGCGNRDPYIPLERVHETAEVLGGMGADVRTRIYEGLGHTINKDERTRVRTLLAGLVDAPESP